ncbi:MAG: Transrane protein [Verrucomicrobiales bacterium]|jgi:hypothetical protein|nr:Transrane protein [Verrucomicrobiales bacterium]
MSLKSLSLLALALFPFVLGHSAPPTNSRYQILEAPEKLALQIDGKLFTEYHFLNVPRPYCYPVLGFNDLPMTRNWPMKTTPDEEHDHPHHQGLWYAHGDVNGKDLWSVEKEFGTTIHKKFTKIESSATGGTIESDNEWVDHESKPLCSDHRKLAFKAIGNEKILDFDVTIQATHGDVTFGDTKEGSMAIRVTETMRVKGKVAKGHIINSEGVKDDQTWSKRADWVDYFGPVEGTTVGVAMFDHPTNPRHPTTWHVRDYGLFAANPFGLHDFEKKPKDAGKFLIKSGETATFRYRFVFHEGDEKQGHVAEHYKAYTTNAE